MENTLDLDGLGLAEDRLQRAVRTNDAVVLANLLNDDLLATAPGGRIVGKQEALRQCDVPRARRWLLMSWVLLHAALSRRSVNGSWTPPLRYPAPVLQRLISVGLLDGRVNWDGVSIIAGTTTFGDQILDELRKSAG